MILTVTPNPSLDRTLLCPAFTAGGTYKARLLTLRPAGKGLNVARCFHTLGGDAYVAAIVGRGAASRFAASLDEQGIDHAFVESHCEVRQSTTVIARVPGDSADTVECHEDTPLGETCETHLREPGGPLTRAEVDALVELVRDKAPGCPWVAVCGSLPEGMEAAGLARLLDAAAARGTRVALDSSGEGIEAARLAGTDLIKPNAAELAQLAGRGVTNAAEAIDAARAVSEELGAMLLVTLGAEGALLVGDGVSLRAKCEPDDLVSSVGAGDAALAGYLWAESTGRSPEDCLRASVAAGTASLAEPAAGVLTAERFHRLLERVEVVSVLLR